MKTTLPLLLLVILLAAGCGRQSGNSSTTTTLRIWYSTDDPVERVWSQQLASGFERTHPKIQVKLVDYSFEDMNTKLQLALQAGNPPDLAYVTPRGPGIPAYVGAGKLRSLTVPAQQYAWAQNFRPGLLADYNRPFVTFGMHPGHVVAVPTSLAAVGVLYNKRLLRRLHLAIPKSIPQFEVELARARAAGYTPIGMGNADGWLGDDWYLTLANALAPQADLQREQRLDPHFTFHRPPYLQAAQIIQRWAQRGYFTKDFGGLDAQEGVDAFFHGTTLFQLVSSSENSQIHADQHQSGLPIGVFAFPRAGGGTVMPVSGYEGWVVPAAAAEPRAAIQFITYLLSPSVARFLERQALLPAHRLAAGSAIGPGWQREYVAALQTSRPGVYLDAAPISNINATMEANVQLLLQGYEPPTFLIKSLQEVYATHGNRGSTARIDGEF